MCVCALYTPGNQINKDRKRSQSRTGSELAENQTKSTCNRMLSTMLLDSCFFDSCIIDVQTYHWRRLSICTIFVPVFRCGRWSYTDIFHSFAALLAFNFALVFVHIKLCYEYFMLLAIFRKPIMNFVWVFVSRHISYCGNDNDGGKSRYIY